MLLICGVWIRFPLLTQPRIIRSGPIYRQKGQDLLWEQATDTSEKRPCKRNGTTVGASARTWRFLLWRRFLRTCNWESESAKIQQFNVFSLRISPSLFLLFLGQDLGLCPIGKEPRHSAPFSLVLPAKKHWPPSTDKIRVRLIRLDMVSMHDLRTFMFLCCWGSCVWRRDIPGINAADGQNRWKGTRRYGICGNGLLRAKKAHNSHFCLHFGNKNPYTSVIGCYQKKYSIYF